mmetsp:Transcript_10802/g.19730  ORF Transcript_10802/g.19730 Transcript_10802/m.19730 type:complete len:1291 (-) Transcript_10802:164-4036(-)
MQPGYEPFGGVSLPNVTGGSTPLAYRRRTADEQKDSSFTAPYPSYGYAGAAPLSGGSVPSRATATSAVPQYEHNGAVAVLLVPALTLFILYGPSPYPAMVLLFASLILYALDLANHRDGVAIGIWVAFCLTGVAHMIGLSVKGNSDQGIRLTEALSTSVDIILLFCLACWCTLQFKWLYAETPSFALMMERLLHSVLPPASACTVTYHLTSVVAFEMDWGLDAAATLAPFGFAAWLALGMAMVGSCQSSFRKAAAEQEQQIIAHDKMSDMNHRAITPSHGVLHSFLLLSLAPMLHLVMFRNRIFTYYAFQDGYNHLILALAVPYLIHFVLGLVRKGDTLWYARELPTLLRPTKDPTLRGASLPICMSVLAAFALQQEYLVPVCHRVAYVIYGHDVSSTWITSLHLTCSMIFLLASVWFYGRRSTTTGDFLLGEQHEDIFQTLLVCSSFFAGLGLGLPWSAIPIPVLSFLSLSLWITTRMMRYFVVFLFVMYSGFSIILSYRFTHIETLFVTPFPGISLKPLGYSLFAVGSALLLGASVGLSVRASGGLGTEWMRKIDAPGFLLGGYATILTCLEFILLKQPKFPFDTEDVEEAAAYEPILIIFTGLTIIGVTWYMRHIKSISNASSMVVLSLAVGKIFAVIVDFVTGDDDEADEGEGTVARLFLRSIMTTILLITIIGPHVFLKPKHIKNGGYSTSRTKRFLGPGGKTNVELPKEAKNILLIYGGFVLPFVLLVSIPLVLKPLVGLLAGHYNVSYYGSAPVVSEVIGYAFSIWGISVLSMTNHFLPDGGAESWQKMSALSFLMGLGVAFTAPTLPSWLVSQNSSSFSTASPFASISSLAVSGGLAGRQGKNGGSGLMSAFVATLLALTGPLELRERKDTAGRKDKHLLLRLMVFSLLFGCGIAWFITIQSMSNEDFVPIFVTATACMAMAFFGTVASVLGHFLEVNDFKDVEQISKVWMGAFPLFLLIASVSSWVEGAAHLFGMGGWASTYLSVCGCVLLAFAVALRARAHKSVATRGLANVNCVIAWLFSIIVVYGKFGIAGIDTSSGINTVFGIAPSVFGTFLVAPILLVLEGENSERKRTHRLTTSQKGSASAVALNLSTLTRANRFGPSIASAALVLVCASLYAIFFRGCGWLQAAGATSGKVMTNHEEVFKGIFGEASRTTAGIFSGEDAASMAQKSLLQNEAVKTAARLAGSSIWTSESITGPLLHMGGLVAVIPGLVMLITQLWHDKKQSAVTVLMLLPLNLIPLLLCRGIPSLRAAAVLGFVGGIVQVLNLRQSEWVGKMRI